MNEIENAVIINISILCVTLFFMLIVFMNGQISHHSELWDSVLSSPFIKDCIVFAEVSKKRSTEAPLLSIWRNGTALIVTPCRCFQVTSLTSYTKWTNRTQLWF